MVSDDSHLWSERYDRVLERHLHGPIRHRRAGHYPAGGNAPRTRAAQRLRLGLTENMEAYQAYLAGIRYVHGSRDEKYMRLTVEMFERAVQLDPGFAVAHALRCPRPIPKLNHYRYDYTIRKARQGEGNLQSGRWTLQPGLPEGHRALGLVLLLGVPRL